MQRIFNPINFGFSWTADGWYDWNVATNEIYFDPRYYTMAGYEPNEFPSNLEGFEKQLYLTNVFKVLN